MILIQEQNSGIYMLTNKINGHKYIGMSKNIYRRMNDHKNKPFSSIKKDDQEKALYNAIRKYGWENFDFTLLEYIEPDNIELMKEREIYWIKYYNTYENREHYNETPGGDIPGYNTVHIGEEHAMAKLTEKDVIFCRKEYAKGTRSRVIYNKYFQDKIAYSGFLRMWHGKSWKHVMPEVFDNNPHKGKYTAKDRDEIVEKYKQSGLKLHHFAKTDECPVGYGTLWKMVNEPEFYDEK